MLLTQFSRICQNKYSLFREKEAKMFARTLRFKVLLISAFCVGLLVRHIPVAFADYASEVEHGKGQGDRLDFNSNMAEETHVDDDSTVSEDDSKNMQAAKDALDANDYPKAFNLLYPLAKKGYVEATCQLAEMYEQGNGVAQDPKEAIRLYKMAARQGTQARLSVHLASYRAVPSKPSELKKFVQNLEKDAQNGDSDAQRVLGTLYFKGLGVNRDFDQSFKWYEAAAKQGNAGAFSNLGFMYQHGAGVPQDYNKAVYYYKKAADEQDPEGTNNLGFMYARGYGVHQDFKKAAELFKIAYEQSNPDAMSNLGWLYQKGKGVPQDYTRALDLYTKAAINNVSAAQYNLGYMYQYGYGVKRDLDKARKYYLLAASKGSPSGENTLGFMYGHLSYTPNNYDEELKMYKKQAQREMRAFIHWDLLEMPD